MRKLKFTSRTARVNTLVCLPWCPPNRWEHVHPHGSVRLELWLEMLDSGVCDCFSKCSSSRHPFLSIFMCTLSMIFIFNDELNLINLSHQGLLFFQVRNKPQDDCKCLCIYFQVLGMGANSLFLTELTMYTEWNHWHHQEDWKEQLKWTQATFENKQVWMEILCRQRIAPSGPKNWKLWVKMKRRNKKNKHSLDWRYLQTRGKRKSRRLA